MDGLGLMQIYTGNGKGKTTAAIGLAVRARGQNKSVAFIQFLKCRENYGETKMLEQIGCKVQCFGSKGFIIKGHIKQGDIDLAKLGLKAAQDALSAYDIVILDEINNALDFGLLSESEVVRVLADRREGCEVVLTGRGATAALLAVADLVTEMQEIKHPYQSGIGARRGIEY